ncbi:CAP domain-containing protein [Streptomyces sp. NRRL S-813]|uniref:CAP domain-containing protein n=1 Tax=Streptomyces sp. NRRL S-813 TaxID=1463919 RepID=UPI0004C19A48|nr:CAP domain-containing protein [Streptomyces sp. NRRL S-813]
MGRHRRSDAGRAATDRATGVADTHGSYGRGQGTRHSHADDRMGIAPYLNPERYADSYVQTPPYRFETDVEPDIRTDFGPEYLSGRDYGSGGDYGSRTAYGFGREYDPGPAYGFGGEYDFARAADTVAFPPEGFTAPAAEPREPGHRRRKKAATPVRTGLLGVSAAVAIGTVAVATGAVPGLQNYKLGGGGGGADKVQAAGTPTNSASEQGGTSGSVLPGDRSGGSGTSRGADRSASPAQSASASASASPSARPSDSATKSPATKPTTAPSRTAEPKNPKTPPGHQGDPGRKTTPAPPKGQPPAASDQAAAEAEVLSLVNQERAKVGCSPVTANSSLTSLAEDFSKAMADQNFFDHTDPSGASPWDRAARLGITNLGGENIARGQSDAAAVMDAWMNSPGHRANILNCDFKTLGVGVHFGPGGPWWTQDFGY